MGMGSSQASIVGQLHDRLIPSGASQSDALALADFDSHHMP